LLKKILYFIPIILLIVFVFAETKILFFYSDNCHACQLVETEVIDKLSQEVKGRIKYLNIKEHDNYLLLRSMAGNNAVVPSMVMDGKYYNKITSKIFNEKNGTPVLNNKVEYNQEFKSITFGALTMAAIIDGVNPCAFATIVFLIAFLTLKKYSKTEILKVVLLFSSTVYVTYLLIGIGLLQTISIFLYHNQINKVFYLGMMLLCYTLALFSMIDFFRLKKGKSEIILQLPKSIKKFIHYLIRERF
jgi:hypothetical protein